MRVDGYTVGEVARLAHVSVRALHHYDEVGLLTPSGRSPAGYRLYSEDDLRRLRRAPADDLLRAIEKEMEARQMGMSLTPEEQFEVFGSDKVGGEWAEEATQRWGDTDAFRESQARTVRYAMPDWQRLKAEADDGLRAFADAMRSGAPPSGDVAMNLAESHRQYLSRWFYDCGYDMHRGLAEMYVADERFRATYDNVAPGLAQYVHDAIIANAARGAR